MALEGSALYITEDGPDAEDIGCLYLAPVKVTALSLAFSSEIFSSAPITSRLRVLLTTTCISIITACTRLHKISWYFPEQDSLLRVVSIQFLILILPAVVR